MSNIVTKEKLIEHPLENEFDIEPGTTIVEYTEVLPAEVVTMPNYDQKDDEIEGKLEQIYTVAMGQVTVLGDEVERVEGRFKARVGEVTATMLNVALGAVREKSLLKQHKDKLTPAQQAANTPHTVNNNLIVADRNELLRLMIDKANMSKK
jgi:hypothetical protein